MANWDSETVSDIISKISDNHYVNADRYRFELVSWHYYAVHLPDGEPLSSFGRERFLWLHDLHWQIEQYHRAIKQVCHVEHFQVRTPTAIQNHVFAAICGYAQLQRLGLMDVLKNCYQLHRNGV